MARYLAGAVLLLAGPAMADITTSSDAGFTLTFKAIVKAAPAEAWAVLVQPARWWSPAHSYSQDARNFSLDVRAGGCFCERWAGGSVEHARIVMAMPGLVLRMLGGFGPLQAQPVAGVLTFTLKPVAGGTEIGATYAVAGQMTAGPGLAAMAAPVNGVLGEQVQRLAAAIDAGKP